MQIMWGNPTFFHWAKSIEKNTWRREILTQSIEKRFFHRAKSIEMKLRKEILTQ